MERVDVANACRFHHLLLSWRSPRYLCFRCVSPHTSVTYRSDCTFTFIGASLRHTEYASHCEERSVYASSSELAAEPSTHMFSSCFRLRATAAFNASQFIHQQDAAGIESICIVDWIARGFRASSCSCLVGCLRFLSDLQSACGASRGAQSDQHGVLKDSPRVPVLRLMRCHKAVSCQPHHTRRMCFDRRPSCCPFSPIYNNSRRWRFRMENSRHLFLICLGSFCLFCAVQSRGL